MEITKTEQVTEKEKKRHISKTERFPRIFKETVRILKEVKTKQKSIKTALYTSKFRGQAFKKVYGLTYNVFKHLSLIDKVIDEIGLLRKEPYLNLEAAEIMVHELAIKANNLPGESKPVLAILKYKDDIDIALSKHQRECSDTGIPSIPRYVRIHTAATSVSRVVNQFVNMGYKHIVPDTSLTGFMEAVRNLTPGEFLQDFHFEDVLVFAPGENLSHTSLYRKGHIFLQDKASCIPVHVLAPDLNSTVLDCCAAPGMKTVHLSSVMQNKGRIIALDRDVQRFATLELAVKHSQATNCELFCMDFSKVDPMAEPYSSVEYILLDPSCSGSGIVSRLDVCTDDKFSKNDERIKKLSGFQIILLKHALKFPNVKRIVYSTCSINEEENEFVISESLRNFSHDFVVGHALPKWPMRGSDDYSFGHLCVRAYPESNLTNGFFVAVIDRILKSNKINNYSHQPDSSPADISKSNINSSDICPTTEHVLSENERTDEDPAKHKKNKRHSTNQCMLVSDGNKINENVQIISETHKKKHKKKDKRNPFSPNEENIHETSSPENDNQNCESVLHSNSKEGSVKRQKRKHKTTQNFPDENEEQEIDAEEPIENVMEVGETLRKASKRKKKKSELELQREGTEIVMETSSKKKKHKKLDKPENVDNSEIVDSNSELELQTKGTEITMETSTKKKKHKKLDKHENVDNSEIGDSKYSEFLDQPYTKTKKHKKSASSENLELLDEPCKKTKKHKRRKADTETSEVSIEESNEIVGELQKQENLNSDQEHQKKKHKRKK